jgi:hypothetical protein
MRCTGTTSIPTTLPPARPGIATISGIACILIEARIDRFVRIERVDLLIANLIIEYVGLDEFVAFVAANAGSIGVLSCVVQRNDGEGFVSSTDYASSFDALASVSSDIEPETLISAMSVQGFVGLGRCEYPLPNGKALVRQDFRPGT